MIDRQIAEEMGAEFVRDARIRYLRSEIATAEASLQDALDRFYKIKSDGMPGLADFPPEQRESVKAATLYFMASCREDRKVRIAKLKKELLSWRKPTESGRISEGEIARARAYPITDLLGVAVGKQVLCPAHPDKRPSAHVYPWGVRCFSCQWHGDSIEWLRKTRGLSFAEAVRALIGPSDA